MRAIVELYFEEHPDAKDDVMKAFYAYHAPHFRLNQNAHNFTNYQRHSECLWCGRSRESVRWDEFTAHCHNRPEIPEIEDCLKGEEEKHFSLLKRGKIEIPKLIAKFGTGDAALKMFHDTHGYDSETVLSYKEAL